jgi:CDP-diacylglycerol---glycerol-3-phosphate 3-phosphatidyltransferase
MNLPNALTVARIAVTPFIAMLPFVESATTRAIAFILFVAAGITDYVDGMLARLRGQVTDLGTLLDPLADKLLLVGTFIPMYFLSERFPFETPFGPVGLPLWVIAIVIGREVAMTVFRQAAARRGVIIAAIGPAKMKTTMQVIWQGSAFFWFFASTLAARPSTEAPEWRAFALFNGTVGVTTMALAVVFTLYSLYLYIRDYGWVVFARKRDARG